MWVGPESCKLAIVTEKMPWQTEPFDGPSGAMFKDTMTKAGIGVEKVAFGFAGDDPRERQASFTVLAGDRALHTVRTDLWVRQCHGRPMMLDHILWYPVFHPEAYWRNPRWRSLLDHELRALMSLARDRENWRSYLPQSCVKCRGAVDYTDLMGVAYCQEHRRGD